LLAVLAGSKEDFEFGRDALALQDAVEGLAARSPELSAATGLPAWQKAALAGLLAAIGGGALLAPEATLVALLAVMAVPFLLVVTLRAVSLWHLLKGAPPLMREEAAPAADDPLPLYSVLVPLYREAGVVAHLLEALAQIDYSADRLEIILIVESVDFETRAALARAGWRVGVLRSTTWEEAPPTYAVWRGQRTRWLKGWMQTYLVHMRQPGRLWRELGARRFVGLQVLMGGLILSALVHPWFYVLVALDLWQGHLLGVPDTVLGHSLLWIGVFNVIAGYVSAIALGGVSAARRGRVGLAAHAALMPVYWLGISMAAYRALVELISAPYYWEKTEHFARAIPSHSVIPDRGARTPPIAAE
jgi:hypothetical protein